MAKATSGSSPVSISSGTRISPTKRRRPDNEKDNLASRQGACQAALEAYDQGHMSSYRGLVTALSTPRSPSLSSLYADLASCVTLLSTDHKDLMTAVWGFDWTNSESAVKAYVNFLVHLVSAHGSKFLSKTFRVLVTRLKLRPVEPEGYDEEAVKRCAELIHPALQKILSVIPGSHEALGVAVIEAFPHLSHPLVTQRLFVENALLMLSYCPPLREKVLPALVDRLIRIDVEIKFDDISEAEADADDDRPKPDEETGLFGMDMEGHHISATIHLSPEEEQRQKEHKENAMKLDCLLELLFSHIQNRSQSEREDYFKILLRSFDSLVLNTHESKYTQFIYFFFAMLHPQFATMFITYLTSHLDGTLNGDVSPSNRNRRLTAVAYIASFLGRAAFLPPSIVRESISFLVRWLHEYLDRHEFEIARNVNIAADAERHGLFYLVTQAALYAFCFKHRTLSDGLPSPSPSHSPSPSPSENINPKPNAKGRPFGSGLGLGLGFGGFNPNPKHSWINGLNLERVVESTLNPLIMIQEQVALEFTNISLNLGIPLGALCERLLQRNKLIVLPTRASFGGENRLDSYFPFDPWMLKVSSKHFKEGYQYWESVSNLSASVDADDDFESSESVHGTPTGVPISGKLSRRRMSSSAMQLARSLEDGGFSLGSYSNSYNMDSEMGLSSIGAGGGFGSYESNSFSTSPVYHSFTNAGFL